MLLLFLQKVNQAKGAKVMRSEIPEHWGIKSLNAYQERAWEQLESGKSGLFILPTGGGKSLLFQLWAYHKPGLVIVLTPLIALIEDQYKRARSLGLKAKGLHSGLESQEKQLILESLRSQSIKLLFVTPERFKNSQFLEALGAQAVSLLVVDEAHLISQWGHDFRPDYRKIDQVLDRVKPKQILALTATATSEVTKDIQEHLKIQNGFLIRAPVARKNLSLNVFEIHSLESKAEKVLEEINKVDGPILIYSSLIKTLYDLHTQIGNKLKRPHWMYHGDLNSLERQKNQKQFLNSRQGVMLATPAFGLGIDKKDIRLVIHLELPGSVEAYFQEVGRSGRDGQFSKAILLYDEEDILIQMDFIKWSNPELSYRLQVLKFLFQNRDKLNNFDLEELKRNLHFYNSRDYRLETTLSFLESLGYLQRAPKTSLGYTWNDEFFEIQERILEENYFDKTQTQQKKLLQLVQFIKNREVCRMNLISSYFDDPKERPCELCDNCLG
jgi:ATP-dependent DNA helicase RecQ